jgi:CRP-like cAMP-binding protein
MFTPEVLDVVRQGRWFAALAPERAQALLEAAGLRTLSAGQTLFRRGDANSGLYAVIQGAVRVGSQGAAGRDALLGLIEPPQWFGEIACLDGGTRTHDATAIAATTLLHLPLPRLEQLAAADPQWWRLLGQLLAEKMRAAFTGLEDLAEPSAALRVARRLLALSQGYGMRADSSPRLRLAVSQEQLGAMLSLSRQTVSEVLGRFEAEGLVRRRYGAVELLDAAGLAAFESEKRSD